MDRKEENSRALNIKQVIRRRILRGKKKKMESSYWKSIPLTSEDSSADLKAATDCVVSHFVNQCSLKSYHAFETNGRKLRTHSMDTAKGAVSDPMFMLTWVSSLLEPRVPDITPGPSWSTWCCLVPWFSLFHSLYRLCGLLYAYMIMWGSQEREEYSTEFGEAIWGDTFFGTFSDCLWAVI